MLVGVFTDGNWAGPDDSELSLDYRRSPSSLSSGSQPYLSCSSSCHGNRGRQYLQVAIGLQTVACSVCLLCIYSLTVRKVPFIAAPGSDFRFPHQRVLHTCHSSVWPIISSTAMWLGVTGCGQLAEWQQFLVSLLWNRNLRPVHHQQQQQHVRYIPPSPGSRKAVRFRCHA